MDHFADRFEFYLPACAALMSKIDAWLGASSRLQPLHVESQCVISL
jgi:hypothetical protein